MKRYRIFCALAIIMGLFLNQKLSAQGANNDSDNGSHVLRINIPEVALLDIWDVNTGAEAQDITLDVRQSDNVNGNSEAGIYDFASVEYSGLYLNYSSVVGAGNGAYNTTRSIHVQLLPGGTFPESLDLRIKPFAPNIIANGGTPASAGTVISSGVALGKTTPMGTDAMLVSNIGSVYTGDQQNGVALTYSLEQNGNFSANQSGLYTATVQYTLSDL